MTKRLEFELFKTIVEHTPLISIDLIIRNDKGEVLLGQRLNRPAKNYWFVPGGRIFKDESFEIAFKRITFEELGYQITLDQANFLGVYEHFYNDNVSGTDFSTHYIVHGYETQFNPQQIRLPTAQHNSYKWFDVEALLHSTIVHQYTKNYFIPR
ncbi:MULTISPECIES: GDP-mannose mannosyl hydrolase [Escherichia]|uniref:GDP-mannose mannosyl hydrolase n=1 Tax=Escherichia TaxID=561 RepID=UPI0002BA5A12|nr:MULTISPECIES: GDP-mannose mannosyl hydrolase [Escherichia]MBB2340303.1 GDP-mannose mannosyl hydrolase [Escherichia sp. 93.0750]EFB2838367.1 GDP-mannose mannosyl hydrolase [Escherichia coli]EFJ2712227.1 GDP-mannose mannosyl hydrolase [Escherichia coli]EHS3895121.1 GDP-mannose mannosyl hydrolase [Escherichia coli]EHS4056153.1 GDP-mannose mannosyl hydrolase [Escherichia coli]